MLKKILSLVLCFVMVLSILPTALGEEAEKVLYYPSYLHQSEGETLVLKKAPERIVCLSNSALQILVRCNLRPIAVSELSSSVEYPDWVKELPTISGTKKSLDIEGVIASTPDLLIVGSYQKATYGQQLADAGIPVYYTSEGPSITYWETKEETLALARSFGTEEIVKEIENEFAEVETRANQYRQSQPLQKMMIFFHTPGGYQQTSQGYLGSMLAMLPFENLSDTVIDPASRTAPIDVETAITLNPQVIFAISPPVPTAQMLKEQYTKVFAENANLWNQLEAVREDRVIYLSNEYVTSKGLHIVNSLHRLIDLLEEEYPGDKTEEGHVTENITIEYPENMKAKGYNQSLVLPAMPQRVVSMSTAPVLTLHQLGVKQIAVPTSAVVAWPEDLAQSAQQMQLAHNSNFNIETVIALEPDLVIMGYTSADTYGKVVQDAGIPVYYVDAGHTVSYDSIKQQTQALTQAFGSVGEEGREIIQRFEELEKRLSATREQLKGKTVMVLQSAPPNHYIQTKEGTLASMAQMIGLTNVYENDTAPMVQLDYETALAYNPNVVLCVGMSPTSQRHQKIMEEDFGNNPEYWNSIPAMAEGNILYLPVEYISSAGINVIDNIDALMDMVVNHFAE